MKHTISGLVENRPGVLWIIADAFKKYNVNIKSIAVGETADGEISRMTVTVEGHDKEVRLITERLRKLKEIIEIDDLARKEFVDRELALVKVSNEGETISKIMQLSEIFRATVVGIGKKTITLEITGNEEKVDGFIRMLHSYGIKELARTGKIALKRGDKS